MKATTPVILISLLVVWASRTPSDLQLTDDTLYITFPELVAKNGYSAEEHFVTTPDGYILRLFRIPKQTTKVIFLMHGLFSSSFDWVLLGPSRAFGYLLSDAGYDVWFGNARGNSQSRNHTTLDPDRDAAFWNFSWHEIGYYDVPSMIDYVLEETKQTKLYHIGHSQGTTSFYVMTSLRPEYNDKVKAHFSLSPIAYMNHLRSMLAQFLGRNLYVINSVLRMLRTNEISLSNELIVDAYKRFCHVDSPTWPICVQVGSSLYGITANEVNITVFPMFLSKIPTSAARKQIIHYGQEIASGDFRQFDYHFKNFEIYGSSVAPLYPIWTIKTPMYLYFSYNDNLSSEVDVRRFCLDAKEACKELIVTGDGTYNHIDYLVSPSAPAKVYYPIMQKLDQFNKEN